jgi:UDP-glucose 6-dehydrogenase
MGRVWDDLTQGVAGRAKFAVDVASNPEFLKEGAAVEDFMKPDRVVVGVRRPEVGEVLRELYAPVLRTENPFLVMSPESAEMTKYVANAMLATKISFINEMANLCERLGADIDDVRRGIGHDERIGFPLLFPGAGYGGSCFEGDESVFVLNSPTAAAQPLREVFSGAGEPVSPEDVAACPCRVRGGGRLRLPPRRHSVPGPVQPVRVCLRPLAEGRGVAAGERLRCNA